MLSEFNFILGQVRYVREAMAVLAAYRPDDMAVAAVDSMIANAKQVRQDYQGKFSVLALKRGGSRETQAALHDACVSVYAAMKSAFRKDAESLALIELLPVDDRSASETFRRGQAIDQAWGSLPNPPQWTGPFKVGAMTRTAFAALIAAMETAEGAETAADGAFQLSEGALHSTQAALGDFVSGALAQGRAQFAPGSPERGVIDTVPGVPSTQEPGQAVVSAATSPAAGAVHLEFDAPHATTFQVWRKGPNEPQFTMVEEVIRPGVYNATGLAAGAWQFQVVGENSRGTGPASEVASVAVAAEAVA